MKWDIEHAAMQELRLENERLRAALQRIVNGHGAIPDRDIAWAALHPENVVREVNEQSPPSHKWVTCEQCGGHLLEKIKR